MFNLTKMWSVLLIRCLPKMSPSSSTSTGSQIAAWRRSLTWTRHDCRDVFMLKIASRRQSVNQWKSGLTSSAKIFYHRRQEWCSSDHRRFSLNPVQRDIFAHRHSQLSDLYSTVITLYTDFFEVYITKQWIYHQMFKRSSDQFGHVIYIQRISHSSFSLVNRLTAYAYRYDDHKLYTDISCSSSVKSIMCNDPVGSCL